MRAKVATPLTYTISSSWKLLANLEITAPAFCVLNHLIYDINNGESAVSHITLDTNTIPAYTIRINTISTDFNYNSIYNYKLVIWE